jgi:hypothetical protein
VKRIFGEWNEKSNDDGTPAAKAPTRTRKPAVGTR